MMEFFKRFFGKATAHLGQLESYTYRTLVKAHITVNAESLKQAEENIQAGRNKARGDIPVPGSNDPYQGDPILTERAFLYVDNIPKVVAYMKNVDKREPSERPSYEDAWWLMMMRLHAWMMGINLVDREGVKISSEYYNNPARVYIL
jgi:hypothetical protein